MNIEPKDLVDVICAISFMIFTYAVLKLMKNKQSEK